MSRFHGADRAAAGRSGRRRRGGRGWHVACFTCLAGCFYIAPLELPPVNSPPVPLNLDPPYEYELTMAQDVEQLMVAANDPDDDVLDFIWEGLPQGVVPVNDDLTNGQYSYVMVPRDPEMDGHVISCVVTDGDETIEVSWRLVVPQ